MKNLEVFALYCKQTSRSCNQITAILFPSSSCWRAEETLNTACWIRDGWYGWCHVACASRCTIFLRGNRWGVRVERGDGDGSASSWFSTTVFRIVTKWIFKISFNFGSVCTQSKKIHLVTIHWIRDRLGRGCVPPDFAFTPSSKSYNVICCESCISRNTTFRELHSPLRRCVLIYLASPTGSIWKLVVPYIHSYGQGLSGHGNDTGWVFS